MSNLLKKLFKGHHLGQDEAFSLFNEFVQGQVDPVLISAFLTALKIKGETPEEIAGAAKALRENTSYFNRPDYATADSCGTGGSGKHTLNISTLVSFIASVKGLKMVKHGNRSISSQCGSADVLEQLGVKIDMSAAVARKCLDKVGISFLFAPLYHQGVKHVMPVRNQLKTRTIFNLLGPLINPANPEYQLMGIYSPEYCYSAAQSLKLSGCKSAMVVHSCGCDEITLAGETHVAHLNDGEIQEYQLSPADFGFDTLPLDVLVGGTPEENAQTFTDVLAGRASKAINQTVAVNAAALFYLSGHSDNLKLATEEALAIIESGQAIEKLEQLKSAGENND